MSKIGTGGMGFSWEAGNWGDMPKVIVEAFLLIDQEINKHQEREQQEQMDSIRRQQRI